MYYLSSHVGGGGFGWHVSFTGQGLSGVASELNGDTEFSLQGVEHVPVLVGGSTVGCLFGQLLLEHSNLGHGLVYIADF